MPSGLSSCPEEHRRFVLVIATSPPNSWKLPLVLSTLTVQNWEGAEWAILLSREQNSNPNVKIPQKKLCCFQVQLTPALWVNGAVPDTMAHTTPRIYYWMCPLGICPSPYWTFPNEHCLGAITSLHIPFPLISTEGKLPKSRPKLTLWAWWLPFYLGSQHSLPSYTLKT